jgi:hypothetical protein
MIITIDDVHKAGLCSRGARQWFALYGLDYSAFLREGGIHIDRLSNVDDALSRKVIEVAKRRCAGDEE